MNQIDLSAQLGQVECVRHSAVPSTQYRHCFISVHHAVAGGAVRHPPAPQLLLPGQSHLPWRGPGGQHHSSGPHLPLTGLDDLGNRSQLHTGHLGEAGLHPEALRTPLHLLPQLEAIHSPFEPWVVVHLSGGCHLSPGGQLLQHHH